MDDKLIFKSLIIKYLLNLTRITSEMVANEKIVIVHNIYAIVLYIGLYLIFNYKKDIKKILPILKEKKIHEKLIKSINEYSDFKVPVDVSIDARSEHSQKYMSKILASIYNFYYVTQNDVKIRDSKYTELRKFLDDIDEYSVEHFLVNDSKDYTIKKGKNKYTFVYPDAIWKKFKNSIFNYIFIPKKLNNDLGNFDIHNKIKIIELHNNEIKCHYSKMFVELAKSNFEDLSKLVTTQDENSDQMRYFSYDFIQKDFNKFKCSLVENIIYRIKDLS